MTRITEAEILALHARYASISATTTRWEGRAPTEADWIAAALGWLIEERATHLATIAGLRDALDTADQSVAAAAARADGAEASAMRMANVVTYPTPEMATAGARSIGRTMSMDNHFLRARACWDAMVKADQGETPEIARVALLPGGEGT